MKKNCMDFVPTGALFLGSKAYMSNTHRPVIELFSEVVSGVFLGAVIGFVVFGFVFLLRRR